jgi:hypothetical protein
MKHAFIIAVLANVTIYLGAFMVCFFLKQIGFLH